MVSNHDTHSLFKCVCLSFSNLVESKHIVCYCDTPERGLVEKQFFFGPEVHFSESDSLFFFPVNFNTVQ